MKIKYENEFKNALSNGIVLFCGAGFSVEAKDRKGKKLPLGNELLNELKEKFSYINNINLFSDLIKISTYLKRNDKTSFEKELTDRFKVGKYDDRYKYIANINVKSIYTTNIDDLFIKIYEDSGGSAYLNDRSKYGAVEKEGKVDYFPLHGCVNRQGGYLFDRTEVDSAYSTVSNDTWKELAHEASKYPILFWGWNFNDSGPINAMYGQEENIDNNAKKWILLYDEGDNNKLEENKMVLESLGYNVIIGSTIDMLDYISNYAMTDTNLCKICKSNENVFDNRFFDKYLPPRSKNDVDVVPLELMYRDYTTDWYHVLSHGPVQTSHFMEIENKILGNKNIMVYGMRGAGKSTLLKQLMLSETINKKYSHVHYMDAPTLDEARVYYKMINKEQVILFIDNCFRDTDALIELSKRENIHLVLFDRDFNFENQFVKIKDNNFAQPVDITEISTKDAQSILNVIPKKIIINDASTRYLNNDKTIPSFLASVLKEFNLGFVKKFYLNDAIVAEVFFMICYVHSCGVACSFDMIYSYLGDSNYTWNEMYSIIEKTGGLLKKIDIPAAENQDYYKCRSQYFAEEIIKSIENNEIYSTILGDILMKFAKNVPNYKICDYDKFQRKGYDADLAKKAFKDTKDGETYYKICSKKDNTEYIYQQAAIYFSRNKKYNEAFSWIEKAKNKTRYNRFSIQSTYAQIYFDASIDNNQEGALTALDLLNECCKNDKRKMIHFIAFITRVLRFYNKYNKMNRNLIKFIEYGMQYAREGIKEKAYLSDKKKKILSELNQKMIKIYDCLE